MSKQKLVEERGEEGKLVFMNYFITIIAIITTTIVSRKQKNKLIKNKTTYVYFI